MRLTFDDYILDVARGELWRGREPTRREQPIGFPGINSTSGRQRFRAQNIWRPPLQMQ
jgi:hypothetical protein